MVVLISCYRAEDFKPNDGQPGMTPLGRLRQARKYFSRADNALQNVKVVPVMTLQVEKIADVIL